jgi:hypothetical protein
MPDTFTLEDAHGNAHTPEMAAQVLVYTLTNPGRAKAKWAELHEIGGFAFHLLAVLANPSLRDEVWDAVNDDGKPLLDDKLKCLIAFNSPANAGEAMDLVRKVVNDVVRECYRMEDDIP